MRSAVYLLCSLAAVCAQRETPSIDRPEEIFPWGLPRLPSTIRPDHYSISIHPDLSSSTFSGQVHILVTALKDTSVIVLHGRGLSVQEALLRDLTLPNAADTDPSPHTGTHSPMLVLRSPNRQDRTEDRQDRAEDRQDRAEDRQDRAVDRQDRAEDTQDRAEDRQDRAVDTQDRAEDTQDRTEDRQDRAEDTQDRTADRQDRAEDRQDRAEDRQDRAVDRQDRAEDTQDRAEDRQDRAVDTQDRAEDTQDRTEDRQDRAEDTQDRTADRQDRAEDRQDRAEDTQERTVDRQDRAEDRQERTVDRQDRAEDPQERTVDRQERTVDRQDRAVDRQDRAEDRQVSLRVLESRASEQLALISDVPLRAGHKFQLSLSYSGTFSSSYSGLYKASYRSPQGDPRVFAATHFEPSSAREAFPCFDEPSMKAVFSLMVVRQSQHISLSNMPKLFTQTQQGGLEEDHYQPSERMSSYLVAFVVLCDFAHNSAQTERGVKVSVFAAEHQMNQTDHALRAAVELLQFYEEYLHLSYPLPKIDLVVIPDLGAPGAMESWGLVTLRETSLLYQEEQGGLRGRVWVTLDIAHELAHQWLGSLVTLQWWNDLWLSEGVASYLQYVAVRRLQPDWCVEDQQLLNTYSALDSDALLTTHPMSLDVRSSTQIREMFDTVSYSKGASVLGMLHMYLSDPVFLGGIQHYLKAHLYNNTQADDLWRAMSEAAEQRRVRVDVKALMDTWTRQGGYPVVSVSVRGTHVHLRQDLFTVSPHNDSGSLWQIPLTFYTSSSSTVTVHLMTSKEDIVDLAGPVSWIKANVNSSGFYRVRYAGAALRALTRELLRGQASLSPADRAGLIDDTFHLARQGSVHYRDAFTLSLFMTREKALLPITVFINHMINMIVRFSFSSQPCIIRLLKEHLWRMLGVLVSTQRWEGAGPLPLQSRRARLLELAVMWGRSPAAEQDAVRLFHFWMAKDGRHPLPAGLRGLIFQVGVRRGGHPEWMFLFDQYRQSASSRDQACMLAALCHSSSSRKITWLLRASLRNHVVKTVDLSVIVEQLASRPKASEMVWRFLQEHWEHLISKFPLGSSYLSRIVTAATRHFNSTHKYDEVYSFFVTQRRLGHLSFVKRSLETIQVNMQWLKKKTVPIQSWLYKAYPNIFNTYPLCKREVAYHFKWGTTIRIRI